MTHTDDINDPVLRGIAADLAAGRCWACQCEAGQPHAAGCLDVAISDDKPDTITAAVIADLEARAAKGLREYGTTLDRTDLSRADWIQHLYEELLDAAQYVKRVQREEGEVDRLRAENVRLREEIERCEASFAREVSYMRQRREAPVYFLLDRSNYQEMLEVMHPLDQMRLRPLIEGAMLDGGRGDAMRAMIRELAAELERHIVAAHSHKPDWADQSDEHMERDMALVRRARAMVEDRK